MGHIGILNLRKDEKVVAVKNLRDEILVFTDSGRVFVVYYDMERANTRVREM